MLPQLPPQPPSLSLRTPSPSARLAWRTAGIFEWWNVADISCSYWRWIAIHIHIYICMCMYVFVLCVCVSWLICQCANLCNRQTGRHADRQTHKQPGRQADRRQPKAWNPREAAMERCWKSFPIPRVPALRWKHQNIRFQCRWPVGPTSWFTTS